MKRIISLTVVCILISISYVVSAEILTYGYKTYDSDAKTVTLEFEKGWTVIPIGTIKSSTCNINSDLTWIYSPTKEMYIARYSSSIDPEDREILDADASDGFRYANTYAGGIFQYLDRDCTITMHFYDGNEKDRELTKIKKGWNFITITPDMTTIPARYIFGTCKLTAINAWSNSLARWGFDTDQSRAYKNQLMGFENEEAALRGEQIQINIGTPEYEDAKFPRNLIGLTYVMKFEGDCEFNFIEPQ